MARALRSPLIPALLLLGLLWPLPGWAAPIGASIALTNVLFVYDPVHKNLSAEAAAIGGLPALPLLNNGKYADTASGNFAVTLNLPPLNQQNLWLVSLGVTFNGQQILEAEDITGPISVMQAYDKALGLVPPGVQPIVKNIINFLLTEPQHALLGLLDWSYNRDPGNDMTGTFALGSTLDVLKVLNIDFPVPPGENTFGFSASVFVLEVPEPVGVLILAPAVLGLVALRRRAAHRVGDVL